MKYAKPFSYLFDLSATGVLSWMITGSIPVAIILAILFVAKQEIYLHYLRLTVDKDRRSQ